MSKTVFVGLSGGVDSSVAAHRLLQAGYTVVGVFIKVWHPDFLVCNWEQERRDAMRVAAHLGIPFLTCDAEAAYYTDVGKYFIREYEAGRTPNPDVMCNQHVKFGAFIDFARSHGADAIATGHYAQVVTDTETKRQQLLRGVDTNKDQSYFLWTLTQAQLAYTLLPVGNSTKAEIRQEASALTLPTASKKDSQGICFLGQVDIHDFLTRFIDLQPGVVYDRAGHSIGTHKGAVIYTLGQRHNFSITDPSYAGTAMYVVARDTQNNTITVDNAPPVAQASTRLTLEQVNYIALLTPQEKVSIQTRYRGEVLSATVVETAAETMVLTLDEPTQLPAIGQSCVLYSGEKCLGGGIIASCQY